jgi:hypothetical protein
MAGPRRSLPMSESQQIHIARQTVQLGVFAAEEIAAGLANGRFQAADLAWTNGMAAWKPLGEWPEFAAVATAPAIPGGAASPEASVIPWEQGKSLGSFFATVKRTILSPRETLATGRFAFGDWLAFCYVALALTLPFQLIALFAFGSKNPEVAELMTKLGFAEAAQKLLATEEPSPVVALVGMVFGAALIPLFYALGGLCHWLGMKLFRLSSTAERVVSATLLATAVLLILTAPFQLLGFSILLQVAVFFLTAVPFGVIYYRALGAATGTSAWVQLGVSCFVAFVVCCCCCSLPFVLLGGLTAGGV